MQAAIDYLAHAVQIWRGAAGSQHLQGGLFNYGMVLHVAGRDDEALKALLESRALRVQQYGASDDSVGEADRLIGEVLASQGKPELAMPYLDRALKLTRVGLGSEHPRTLSAQLSLARHLARDGKSPEAMKTMEGLAVHSGKDSEMAKLRWSARAYLAEVRCRTGQPERARRELDALVGELRRERPDGGALTREVLAIRAACRG